MIKILDIKKKKNKYIIDFENESIEVYEEVLIKMMLLKKRDLDEKEYNELLGYKKYYDSLYLAIKYLHKPRTIYEVKKYLMDLNCYDKKIINNLLDMGLLNDRLYTDMYVDYQVRINLKGPNLIKKELEIKGVHLDFIYPNYEEIKNKVINKYLKNNKNKSSKMLNYNLNKYLLQRGFDTVDNIYQNNDRELIEKDIDKLLLKYKKIEKNKLRLKMYQALLNKGYESSLINEFLDKL